MSSTNGPDQFITRPTGGGALRGLGEKFAPDLHTGTGNFAIPLAVPPGRGSLVPELTLAYSSGQGNGPFGLGWSIGVPGISRRTSHGVPRYDDARDVFVLTGAEDLVPVGGGPAGVTRYRPRTEGIFARIERRRTADTDVWEVRSQDGRLSVYGTPGVAGHDPATVSDPADRSRVFAWKLTRIIDTFGNRIEYRYERDAEAAAARPRWDQSYLAEIRYADYGDPAAPSFLASVRFVYEDRPDSFAEHRAGFEIRTVRRCTSIEVRTHAGADLLARTYHLTYQDQRDLPSGPLPVNGVSLLSQIQTVGHDGDLTEAMPPLDLAYTRFDPDRRDLVALGGPETPPSSLGHPDYALVDLLGNGLPDVLEMNETVRYWRNLGGGQFDRPRQMRDAPAGVKLADPGVQLLDADGDARPDLLVTTAALSGYFPLQFGGLFDRRSFQRYRRAPSFNLEDPEVRLVDLDGDGVTDAIRSGTSLECFFNDPRDGWTTTRRVERRALDQFPNVSFSDPRVKLADMDGDGLQDVVLVTDGSVEYWPSLGHGDWGARTRMARSPRFAFGYDPRLIQVGDVDGDGLADLVYVDDGRVLLWINQGGFSWSDPIEILGTPRVTDRVDVRLADVLGTGVSGVLWSADTDGSSRPHAYFLDLTGGLKPYLLNTVDNRIGAVTRIEYASSTRYYLEDERRPATRWTTPLPFPVQVVARVETIDQISGGKLTSEYSYHHGYWDGVEREFRGFGRVDQRDTERFEADRAAVPPESFSPPTETRTWFHQGAVSAPGGDWAEADHTAEYWPDDPPALSRPTAMLAALPRSARRDALRTLRGSIVRTELYALDGSDRQDRPFTVSESVYGVREESAPTPAEDGRMRIFFPHLLAERATQWERGDDPMTSLSLVDGYDPYGHPRREVSIAVPRGRAYRETGKPGEPYLVRLAEHELVQRDDADRFLAGLVCRSAGYVIVNDGSADALSLYQSIVDGTAERQLTGQTVTYYDGPAFEGLPFGQVGDYGAVTRAESLVQTEETLREAYADTSMAGPAGIPPYLVPGGKVDWTDEYPAELRASLPPLAGYVFHEGGPGDEHVRGYFVVTGRHQYDWQLSPDGRGRGLMLATRDPLGADMTVAYDSFDLMPNIVVDPAGLTTHAVCDYRVFQPREVTEVNGNRTAFRYTPLGALAAIALLGKDGEQVGDTLDAPSQSWQYDAHAFHERGQPISVRTISRLHHVHDRDVPELERDETFEAVAYADGFGRTIQTRAQAEDLVFGDQIFGEGAALPTDQALPGGEAVGERVGQAGAPRVVVSGWQVYDNKGRVVEKYEPFFSTGFAYAAPTESQLGRKSRIFFDARGQVCRTLRPDGSENRVVFGVPHDLADPDHFTPTAWEAYTYDANDNAGRTDPSGTRAYANHWDTPNSAEVDALGRTVRAVVRSGPDPADVVEVRSTYDILGRLVAFSDALGRVAARSVFDLSGRTLRSEQLDGGPSLVAFDAGGNLVEGRDARGALTLHAYDVMHRPTRLWARDRLGEQLTLRERMVYAESEESGLDRAAAALANLLGELYQHYDEAGLLTVEARDFKGNITSKLRRVLADDVMSRVYEGAATAGWEVPTFRVDWQPPAGQSIENLAGTLLDRAEYRTSRTYDATNRSRSIRLPEDVEGRRRALRPRFNRSGALESISLDDTVFVERIAHDAAGQRTLIAFGNGVMTRFAYDHLMGQLVRLRSERYTSPAPGRYRPTGAAFQDLAYTYDLVGNIVALRDRTPEGGVPNTPLGPDALDRVFTYDALYQLTSATGREYDAPPEGEPWEDRVRDADRSRTRPYVEEYEYDPAGNLRQLRHLNTGSGYTRRYDLADGGNRLATISIDKTEYRYAYDDAGNLVAEGTSRRLEWDHANRVRSFRTQIDGVEPSVHTHYLYDAAGMRVKKLVRKQGGRFEATVYVDGMFEHRYVGKRGADRENNTVHVMDGSDRIALVRIGPALDDDTGPDVQYILADHLGSSNVVLDAAGVLVNREEYTPYGETSFGSFGRKRYRFCGQERDEESGFAYHSARYYAPWTARWLCRDPAGMVDGPNLYRYSANNPVVLVDPSGTQSKDRPPACNPFTQCCVPPPEPYKGPSWEYHPGTGETIEYSGDKWKSEAWRKADAQTINTTVNNIKGGPVAPLMATKAARDSGGDPYAISAAAAKGAAWDALITAGGSVKTPLQMPEPEAVPVPIKAAAPSTPAAKPPAAKPPGSAAPPAKSPAAKSSTPTPPPAKTATPKSAAPAGGASGQTRAGDETMFPPDLSLPNRTGKTRAEYTQWRLEQYAPYNLAKLPTGETVLVLSGHGSWSQSQGGYLVVPEGTSIKFFVKHGEALGDALGGVIDASNGQVQFIPGKTYKAGDRIPDYVLHPPGSLQIKGNPFEVTESTPLRDILRPNMGCVFYAACRVVTP